MPLSYAELRDIHDSLGLEDSLPEWAARMNRTTGTNAYAQGLSDSWLRRRSQDVDRLLDYTGIPDALGSFGGQVGGLFGAEDAGRSIGHGLLRTALDFVPMTFAAPLGLAAGAGLGISSLLSGIRGYGDTGKVSSGVIGAATTALMPGAARLAGQGTLRAFGAPLVEGELAGGLDAAGNAFTQHFAERLPQNLTQGISSFAAQTLAGGGVGEISDAVDAAFDPDRDYEFDPARSFLGVTLGQLPFAGHLLGKEGMKQFGGKATREHEMALRALFAEGQKIVEKKQAELKADARQGIENVPLVTPLPEVNLQAQAEAEANVQKILSKVKLNNQAPTESGVKENEQLTNDYEDLWASHGELLANKPLELPVLNPEEKPAFTDNDKLLHEAHAAVDSAKTLPEFHVAVGGLNQVRKQMGLPLLTQERINTIAENRKLTATESVKAIVNKTQRLADVLAEPETERETQRAKDQENVLRAQVSSGGEVAEGAGENRGTAGGVPIVPLPKTSSVTEPIHQLVEETVHGLAKQAEQDFTQWQAKTKASTSFGEEVERYKIYEQLRNDGDIGVQTKLTPDEIEVLNDAFGDEGLRVEKPEELVDFPARPHILSLDRAVQQKLAQKIQENSSPSPVRPSANLPAGDPFVWGFENYDEATNKIGKHTLPKTGVIRESQLKNIAGRGKPLSDAEIELGKSVVPEAFDGQGNVDVRKLFKGLREKGPVVEIKTLGEDAKTDMKALRDRVNASIHELDTLGVTLSNFGESINVGGQRVQYDSLTPRQKAAYDAYLQAKNEHNRAPALDTSSARYSFLGPKPESAMPGYVEGLVRVPAKTSQTGATIHEYKDSVKFRGPHFGSEDTNVLAFFRGYEETLPSGEKAFHVIEVQSDWGQEQRRKAESANSPLFRNREAVAKKANEGGHPLLPLYETLALKAAIAHAKSVGATKIILSDAETAMMTEGHDKVAQEYRQTYNANSKDMADAKVADLKERGFGNVKIINQPDGTLTVSGFHPVTQEKGMRLHYDSTLPSAMAKLTGEKGERVEVGTHKQADLLQNRSPWSVETSDLAEPGPPTYTVHNHETGEIKQFKTGEEADNYIQSKSVGSPVFKDASGQPKSSITGRVYDLSKIAGVAEQQGGLTLTDPSRAPVKPQQTYQPVSEQAQEMLQKLDLKNGGTGLANFIATDSPNPQISARAKLLLEQYPELLKRTQVIVTDPFQGSHAHMDPYLREGAISLDGGMLDANPEMMHEVALHELEHQVSQAELDNPTKSSIRENLDALRQRMIEALPTKERKALDAANQNGWLKRWSDNKAEFSELHPDPAQGRLLYGLLNTKEFVAEGGVPNTPLRKFMLTQKGKGQGWFTKFKGYIKQLLGYGEDVKGTALGEFMEHTNALYDRGEHIASFYNFAERFFEGRGDNRQLAQSRTLQAASLLHEAAAYPVKARDLFDSLARGGSQMSRGEAATTRLLQRSILNKDEDFGHLLFSAKDVGIEPSQRGLDQFLQEALNGTSLTRSVLTTMPETAARYMFEKAKSMKSVLEGLQAASDQQNDGYLNLANPKSVRKPVADALKAVNKVLAYEKEFNDGRDIIQSLAATTPQGFLAKTLAAAPKWSDASPAPPTLLNFLDPADTQPKQKGKAARLGDWFKRNFGLMNQYTDKVSQELFTKMRQLGANIHRFATDSLKMWAGDLQSGDDSLDARKGIIQVIKNVPVRKAADKIIYGNQVANRDAVTFDEKAPHVQEALKGLTPQQRTETLDSVKRHQLANIVAQKNILGGMSDIATLNATGLLNSLNGQKQQHNNILAQTMWDALNVDQKNPVAVAKMQSDLVALQQRMQPEEFNALYKYLDAEHQKYQLWSEHFKANPAWSSAKRQGEYIIEFKDKAGNTKTAGVDSKKEADQLVADQGGKLLTFKPQIKPGDEEMPNVGPDWQGVSDRLHEYDENAVNILRSVGGWSEDDIATYRKLSPANMFSKEVNASGIPDMNAPKRQLNRGAEDVPYIENHISWINQQARFWNRKKLRAEFDSYLRQKELTPEMKEQVTLMRDNFLRPDPESVKKINSFVRTWYLGAQLAVPMMNLTQFMQTHVGELTAMTGSIRQGYSRIMSTLGQLTKRYIGGEKTWSDPEYARLEKDAKEMGELGGSKFDDDATLREATATNLQKAAQYGKPKTMWQHVTSLFGGLSKASMALFSGTETFNNHLGILTAFKLFREQGQSYQEARDNAFTYNARVNFTGAKAARPLGMGFQSKSPTIRGAAMLASAMKSYMLGSLGQTIRFINRGFFDNSTLTPAQRFAAKKAAIQVLGTQVAAAGLVGLPFVSALLGLIEKMTGYEANKKLRETVHQLFNEDDENGGALSDATMTGLPSMLGWDMQSRLSAGNSLPGVSEFNGFQPENLLGPSVNLISDFVRGTGRALSGNNPTSLVPPALRKLEQLIVNDGQIKDYRERPVLNDLTAGEKTGIFFGFNPKRLSDFNAAARMSDLSEHNVRQETTQLNQQLAEEAMRGNFGSVRQTLLQKAQQDKNFDPVGAVEDISRVAEELTFPRDLRREGYDPSKSKVLSYFNLAQQGPSEVARLQFRSRLQQSLGLPTPPSASEVLLAQTIDALHAKQPGASRSELRRTAELLLRRTSREQVLGQ